METKRVAVGEDVLSVSVRPGDPTILFLHGLAGHGGEWTPVIHQLSPDVGILNPDQRAHGATWEFGTTAVSRAAYVDDAIALIEQCASDQVLVVGQSMGGVVATLVAHARPDLVTQLVLIEAGMSAMSEADLSKLQAWFDSWPDVFVDDAEAHSFFGMDAPSTPAWIDGLEKGPQGLTRRFDPEAMLTTMRVLAMDDRWSKWGEITVPTTLIKAADGTLGEHEVARIRRVRPEAEIVTVQNSGHDVHLDQPEQVAAVLREILRDES